MVLVGDIGAFGLREFAAQCPGRFLNAGIREQAMASAAAGLALAGMIPVVHSITPFVVERCFEQIKDDFGYQSLGGNFVSVGAGFDYAALGCTHHSYSDVALLKSVPGAQVFYPGSPKEFDCLFRQTYASGSLNYFRLGGRNHSVDFQDSQIGVGRAILAKEGRDLTLVTAGPLLNYAMKVASDLQFEASIEVIYTPSIKPFDARTMIDSVAKTRRVVVFEDHSVFGGLADEVRRALDCCGWAYSMKSLGVGDEFLRDYGSFDFLANTAGIGPEAIQREVKGLLAV